MIVDLLLNLLLTLRAAVWGMVPAWTIDVPPQVLEAADWLKKFDTWAPVSEFTQQLGLLATGLAAFAAFKIVVKILDWITNVIP